MTNYSTDYQLTYTIGTETHSLSGFDTLSGYTFNLIEFAEVGLPPITRITQRGAFQHGDTNVDFRLNPRTFTIRGYVDADNDFDHLKVRDLLGRIFKVTNTAATLTMTSSKTLTEAPFTQDTLSRAINCVVNGGLNVSSDTSNGYGVFFDIELRADNPLWYNPQQSVVPIATVITGDPTDIPGLIPRTYGTNTINTSTNVYYDGTFMTYPIITIYGGDGGITNLVITNATQGRSIIIPAVPLNTTYTLDLRYGYKTAVDQTGASVITSISPASNMTTFAIVPTIEVASSFNTLTVTAATASNGAYVNITYNELYTGI